MTKQEATAGANCAIEQFLKDLWHPIKEKPQKERVFLYQTADNAFGINSIVEAGDWKFITKYQRADLIRESLWVKGLIEIVDKIKEEISSLLKSKALC